MNYKLLFLFGLLFFPSLISAIYAGESMEIDLSSLDISKDVFYFIVGNSSNTEGMIITLNEITNNASVDFAINFQPDNFTIVFFNNITNEVIKEVHHYSSGGSRTKYIENKTIIEVPIDKEVFVDREIYIEDTSSEADLKPIETTFGWWYLYGFLLIGLVIGVYFWIKSINNVNKEFEEEILKEEVNDEK